MLSLLEHMQVFMDLSITHSVLYGTAESPKEWQDSNKENVTRSGEQPSTSLMETHPLQDIQDIDDEPEESNDDSSTSPEDLAAIYAVLHLDMQVEDDP